MLKTVLLPISFDEDGERMLRFAQGLTAMGVRVVVLTHAVEASGMEGPIIAARVDETRAALASLAARLEEVGLIVELRVPTGDAFDAIIAQANELGVDAIACGSHAKGIMTQLVEGSVSGRLVRDAPVPMLLVRYDLLRTHDEPARLLRRFGDVVLLPTDFSLSASRAFMRLLELPRGFVRTLYLMHVLDPALVGEKLRRAEEGAEFQLRNMQAMAAQHGLASTIVIRRGEAQRAILEEVDERRATGVITGTRGRNAIQEALMGSVTMTLLRQASCPVLIVP